MSKLNLILVLAFLMVFAAGASTGLLVENRASARSEGSSRTGDYLDLTPQQREQMRQIWSDASSGSWRAYREQQQALRQEADEEVRAMLPFEVRIQYDVIMGNLEMRKEQLLQQRQEAYRQAREKTRAILTDQQRERYDQWMTNHRAPKPSATPGQS